ncbi:MAG TPA: hybrid sensor histidine kinase/response regulator [Gemmatimonadaceae bacterium]|nr:hybrid sensor histidine kinase/response regulator [Gemmatimonadaceae bacterium]
MTTPCILIVDDQPTMRAVVVAALSPLGYRLLEAGDGESALRLAAEVQPDVILLDVMLPGMSGIDVTRRLREDPTTREIPVVILTALDDKKSRGEALAAGADDVLTKPTDLVELRLRVQVICRLNRYRLLVEQRSNVAAFVEGSAIGTLVCSIDGVPLFANEFARRVFRLVLRPAGSPGAPLEPLDPETRQQVMGALRTAQETGVPVQVPARGPALMAGVREFIVSATYWSGLPAIRVDAIEARRATELEMQMRHRERLVALGQLSAGVAHELASVLTIIDLAAQRPDLVGEGSEATRQKIRSVTSRGAELLRQLLQTARPQASRVRGVAVAQLRDEMLPRLELLLLGTVDLDLLADDATSIPLLRADVEQVLINLVTNARDAGAERVTIEVVSTPAALDLIVHDDGRGLDPRVASSIGGAFVTTRAEKGHGLGVWTVRHILEDVGGTLRYVARAGGGTSAICHMPVFQPAAAVAP